MLLLNTRNKYNKFSVVSWKTQKNNQNFEIFLAPIISVGPVAQPVQRLATGWKIWGSNPGGGEVFLTCPDRPWGPPSLVYNGYRVFPGVKSGRGVTLTPHPLLVPWS
jgi:hypothetical protein